MALQGWTVLEKETTLHCSGCDKDFRARSVPNDGKGWCATTGKYEPLATVRGIK